MNRLESENSGTTTCFPRSIKGRSKILRTQNTDNDGLRDENEGPNDKRFPEDEQQTCSKIETGNQAYRDVILVGQF